MDSAFVEQVNATAFLIIFPEYTLTSIFRQHKRFHAYINTNGALCNSSDPDILAQYAVNGADQGYQLVERPLTATNRAIWPGSGGYPIAQWVEQVRIQLDREHTALCRPVITFLAASTTLEGQCDPAVEFGDRVGWNVNLLSRDEEFKNVPKTRGDAVEYVSCQINDQGLKPAEINELISFKVVPYCLGLTLRVPFWQHDIGLQWAFSEFCAPMVSMTLQYVDYVNNKEVK